MIDRILVPVDGSKESSGILIQLQRLVGLQRLEVTLMRVVSDGDDHEREDAYLDLAQLATMLRAEEIEASQRVEAGDPVERILKLVGELKPDLVAMATHGRTGLARLVRGSVAEGVLRGCPAPLFLCNPKGLEDRGEHIFRRVLVPLDGSPAASSVLAVLEDLGRRHRYQVRLLRVLGEEEGLIEETSLDPDAQAAAAAALGLGSARGRLIDAGLEVAVTCTRGAPAEEILKAADDVDLVAMSTHGRSGTDRLWAGSVAEEVLRRCQRPLIIVRRTTPAA